MTAERIERALRLCAYLVARDEAGLVYVPIMDRLEAELAQARAAEDPVFRARRLLAGGGPDAPVLVRQISLADRTATDLARRDERQR